MKTPVFELAVVDMRDEKLHQNLGLARDFLTNSFTFVSPSTQLLVLQCGHPVVYHQDRCCLRLQDVIPTRQGSAVFSRFSSYAKRRGVTPTFTDAAVGSPRKREQKGQIPTNAGTHLAARFAAGTSFTLQLFQRTLEETLASFQKSNHKDVRNLHIEF
ncbi:unnamed protein product [Fraxinus pennsylvanica]|uniref:Uncharacterized protein n=1 Tax=Fraxinus pennsylvanica TaxID=56036 RepID=A0AAD1ZV24_9LAMI|nr:unnamed protein product [Fraxinus pennsylvanica]